MHQWTTTEDCTKSDTSKMDMMANTIQSELDAYLFDTTKVNGWSDALNDADRAPPIDLGRVGPTEKVNKMENEDRTTKKC